MEYWFIEGVYIMKLVTKRCFLYRGGAPLSEAITEQDICEGLIAIEEGKTVSVIAEHCSGNRTATLCVYGEPNGRTTGTFKVAISYERARHLFALCDLRIISLHRHT